MTEKELKILIIPGLIPYPHDDGGKLCIFGSIDYLRSFHDIEILLNVYSAQENDFVMRLIQKWPNVKIHIVKSYQDEITKTGSMLIARAKSLLKPMRKASQLLKNLRAGNANTVNTDSYFSNSMPFGPHSPLFINTLNDLLTSVKFDIIQTELTHMLNLVNIFPEKAKKVFVQIEGRGDVLYDYGISNQISLPYVNYVAGNTRFLEYSYMNKYDAVLALNDEDKIKISNNVSPRVKVYASPFGILDTDIQPLDISNYTAEHLVFMGGENHHPNLDGLTWFLRDVLPTFDKRPFKKIFVTGLWTEQTIAKLQQISDCVEFVGFIDNLQSLLRNSVSIVPIRIGGGGIRTKILTAMSYGSAVVSTTLGAVFMKDKNGKEILLADNALDFSNAISKLFDNPNDARAIVENGYNLLVSNYSQSAAGALRSQIYHDITGQNDL